VPGQVGLFQATEAIKLILKIGKPLIGQFLIYNALDAEFKHFPVKKNPSCPLCNDKPEIKELTDYHEACGLETRSQATI
jgi:molybdopterin/thiamine biosynthesis adenylyltransferase